MNNNLTENLMSQFHQCTHLIRHRSSREHHRNEEGLAHRGQGRLLRLLLERDGLSHTEIVDALGIRPPSVTELVIRLELSGQIYKNVNETDKRVSNVYLTEEGRKNAEALNEQRKADVTAIFGVLNQEEQSQLSDLLTKLIESLKDSDETNEDHHGRHKHRHGRGGHSHHGFHGRHNKNRGHHNENSRKE